MPETATAAPERYEYALLDLLHTSKTNPRKHITEDSVAELAASIKEHGIIEPLIVEDLGKDGYVIVAGERRILAARVAGLVEVPVIVRPFTPEESFLVRLIENIQREDLSPLDLAAGYQRLIKEFKWTADQVAEKVGRKRRTIYATMQLLTLSSEGRKALENGELTASVASLLARVPEKRQGAAFIALRGYGATHGSSMLPDATGLSVRHAEKVLRDFIGTPLAGVPWKLDDATLLLEQGPCTTCPFNTRNIPDLADVYGGADVCTNAKGFAAKQTAQHARDQERWGAKGAKVLTAAESKKLSSYGYFDPRRSGFVALTETAIGGGKTYSEILKGKENVQVYVGRGPKGGEVKLVKIADVKPHLEEAGVAVHDRQRVQTPEEKAKHKQERLRDSRATVLIVQRVHERMAKVKQTPAFIPLLIRAGAMLDEVPDEVLDLRGVKGRKYDEINKWLDKLKPADVLPVWLESTIADNYRNEPAHIDAILKLCGLPPYDAMLKDARNAADAEFKAAAKAAAKEDAHVGGPKADARKKSARPAKKVAK